MSANAAQGAVGIMLIALGLAVWFEFLARQVVEHSRYIRRSERPRGEVVRAELVQITLALIGVGGALSVAWVMVSPLAGRF